MMRHWIPGHDEPWDKASFDLSLTGPLGKTIASIGILDSADALIHFEHLPDMIDIYSNLFGPYVFDKVGYAATVKGAMEHQTPISYPPPGGIIGPSHGRDGLIAHELAHMWWGDWVTVGDWRDIWLNEGFATYSEALFF